MFNTNMFFDVGIFWGYSKQKGIHENDDTLYLIVCCTMFKGSHCQQAFSSLSFNATDIDLAIFLSKLFKLLGERLIAFYH